LAAEVRSVVLFHYRAAPQILGENSNGIVVVTFIPDGEFLLGIIEHSCVGCTMCLMPVKAKR